MRGNSSKEKSDIYIIRNNDLRRSTGQVKDKRVEQLKNPTLPNLDLKDISNNSVVPLSDPNTEDDELYPTSPSVHHLIKGFQSLIGNGNTKISKVVGHTNSYDAKTGTGIDSVNNGNSKDGKAISNELEPKHSLQNDSNYKTPGYVVESSFPERTNNKRISKRKLSIRGKKTKNISADDTRYNIIHSLGMSPFETNENRNVEKSFAFFDIQSLFFDIQNAASLKVLFEDGSTYIKKLSGASAASARNQTRKRLKSGETDPQTGRVLSRSESLVDEGDPKENHLLLSCPYFRNEIAEPECAGEDGTLPKHGSKDIARLISMFNRNRSFENLQNSSSRSRTRLQRKTDTSEEDILLEGVQDDSQFFTWDEPNVNENQLFEIEHIDRGAMYYKEFFKNKEHFNLFGIDEKYGPMAISIIREALPKMAVLGHHTEVNEKSSKKYQYRIIFRTCELYTLRISILENSIPSTSRHGQSRQIPLKDIIEYCFTEVQLSCLKHCAPGPKVSELLMKLDQQQLSTTYKIGLLYCKASQKTEEEMYNNEHAGSEFLEFCSIIADTVTLREFTGYRAQLDTKNDSTGHQSLYTVFHGREIMFHVSTNLPFTKHDRQQLLRKRHIGNDIVTVVFQEPGSEPFTPQIMRSHYQHVFIIVRVENPHSEHTKYEVAMTRSRDVPYFGPPIPPDKFERNSAFREFLLSKLINAENAAHKSDKFTHLARRTRYGYLKDLATNHVSQQTLEVSSKFGFSFSSKRKEKSHPTVNPEIWLQGGLVWTVKFDFEHDGPGSMAFLSISTKAIVFIEQSTQEVLVSIPCRHVLGWRTTSHTLKLFYDNGKMAFFTLVDDDINELPFVVNRLKAVTPGCETMDLTLRRNINGQLGFHVFYEGLVAEVEPYGLAWQAGLRKGSRLLEISGHIVGNMSHERMILMLKRPGVVRIVVLPPAPDGQPRNYKAVRNLRRYSSMTSVYSMSVPNLADSSSCLSSSKENLGLSSESANDACSAIVPRRPRSLSMEKLPMRDEICNSASGLELSGKYKKRPSVASPAEKANLLSLSQEHPISSHSASDLPATASPSPILKPKGMTPSISFDTELGEIERQLTDTRKSIDAKFYRSLANSSSPFFRPAKPLGLVSKEDSECSSDDHEGLSSDMEDRKDNLRATSPVVLKYDVVQSPNVAKEADIFNEVTIVSCNTCSEEAVNKEISRKSKFDPVSISKSPPNILKNTEKGFTVDKLDENIDILHRNVEKSGALISRLSSIQSEKYVLVKDTTPLVKPKRKHSAVNNHHADLPKQVPISDQKNTLKYSLSPLRKTSATNKNVVLATDESFSEVNHKFIVTENVPNSEGHVLSCLHISSAPSIDDQASYSDSSICDVLSRSRETLTSEKDSDSHRGNLVRTKVRDASEILNEHNESKFQETPCTLNNENGIAKYIGQFNKTHGATTQNINSSCKSNFRDATLIKSIDIPPKKCAALKHQLPAESILGIALPFNKEHHPQQIKENNNLGQCIENTEKFDESLNETFARLDAAFGFRRSSNVLLPSNACPRHSVVDPPRDEKRKRKKNNRRRSRNFEPPSSDSSDGDINLESHRRIIRSQRRANWDDDMSGKGLKSEAEESLEAAISDFRISLSGMRDKNINSDEQINIGGESPLLNNSTYANDTTYDHAVPISSNYKKQQPFIKLKQMKTVSLSSAQGSNFKLNRPLSDGITKTNIESVVTGSEPRTRSRSEAKISMSYKRSTNSSQRTGNCLGEQKIMENPLYQPLNTISKLNEDAIEEIIVSEKCQVTPSPATHPLCGIQRMPITNKKERRATVSTHMVKPSNVSCIPLTIRGLDLAAAFIISSIGPWSKEDMHVMLTVMENELEQEREEKERLSQELDRSREEKEKLLAQSKQVEFQLRKYNALFNDNVSESKKCISTDIR